MADGEAAAGHDPLAVVHAHVEAFNARDVERVVATFAEDAVFAAEGDVVVGRRALRAFFATALAAGLDAQLEVQRAVVEGDTAACELAESLDLGGGRQTFHLAAFYTVRDGRLARVRVYRDQLAR